MKTFTDIIEITFDREDDTMTIKYWGDADNMIGDEILTKTYKNISEKEYRIMGKGKDLTVTFDKGSPCRNDHGCFLDRSIHAFS